MTLRKRRWSFSISTTRQFVLFRNSRFGAFDLLFCEITFTSIEAVYGFPLENVILPAGYTYKNGTELQLRSECTTFSVIVFRIKETLAKYPVLVYFLVRQWSISMKHIFLEHLKQFT